MSFSTLFFSPSSRAGVLATLTSWRRTSCLSGTTRSWGWSRRESLNSSWMPWGNHCRPPSASLDTRGAYGIPSGPRSCMNVGSEAQLHRLSRGFTPTRWRFLTPTYWWGHCQKATQTHASGTPVKRNASPIMNADGSRVHEDTAY